MLLKLVVLSVCVLNCLAFSHIRHFGNIFTKSLSKSRYLGSEKITKLPNAFDQNRAAFAFPKVCSFKWTFFGWEIKTNFFLFRAELIIQTTSSMAFNKSIIQNIRQKLILLKVALDRKKWSCKWQHRKGLRSALNFISMAKW